MNITGHRPRWHASVAVLLTFLLIAALFTGLAPAAAAVTARDITSACPPGQVPTAGFRDTAGSTFAVEIDCIVAYGVAEGTSRTTYSPGDTVTRGQMASFLARTLEAAGRTRPANLPDRFRDDDGTRHEANINWLALRGVAGGFADGTYRPSAPVTRAQMATFLSNVILELDGRRPTSTSDHFWDDDGNHHEANINGLASEGIATGIGGTRFNPNGLVTRQQMAGFLARELDYLVDTGHVSPIGTSQLQVITVAPATAATLSVSNATVPTDANRGARTYTATVPAGVTSVNLALLPPSSVVTATGGAIRFTSTAPIAANGGTGFEVVNGTTIDVVNGSEDRTTVNGVTVPNDRVVTFTIDSVVLTSAVPVVYEDSINPQADQLDLEAPASPSSPQRPSERFGVGGMVTWQGLSEPATGDNPPVGTVREVNLAASYYTLDVRGNADADVMIRFPAGDTFSYAASNRGSITRAEFQTWLSAGDRVDVGTYRPGQTPHVVVGDVPNAPTNVLTRQATITDVRITFTKPTNPVAVLSNSSYRLQRAPVTNGVVGSYTEVASITGEKPAEFTNKPAKGTWAYRVIARSTTGDSPSSGASIITSGQPPEPVEGTNPPAGTVREVDLASSYYTLDVGGTADPEYLIRFPNGDTFNYTAVANRGTISRTEFQSWLSVGDRVDPGVYRPGQTQHVLAGDVPNAPTNVVTTLVDGTNVRVTFTKPTNPVASVSTSSYRLQRAAVVSGIVGSYSEVASITGEKPAEFTNAPAQGTWAYRVIARSTTGDSPPSNASTITTGASTVAPATTASSLNDRAPVGDLGTTDQLTFTFDRAITVSPNWTMTVVDHEGHVGLLSASTANAAVSGTASNTLTLTLTSGPVMQNQPPNSTASVDTGTFLQVRSVTGIGNAATWNLPKSGLQNTYNNSRVIVGRPSTPVEPAGSLVAKVGTSTLSAGVNEVQTLKVTGATGGTYTLETGTGSSKVTSEPIPHNATLGVIQTAIANMTGIGSGNVQLTGDPYGAAGADIRFEGTLSARDVLQLVPDGSKLNAGAEVVVNTTTNGAAVSGVSAGDMLRVHSTAGVQLGAALAGSNGLATVGLSQPVTSGQSLYVVVEQPVASGRFSRTATVTATP
jgi:hypothetical protein